MSKTMRIHSAKGEREVSEITAYGITTRYHYLGAAQAKVDDLKRDKTPYVWCYFGKVQI